MKFPIVSRDRVESADPTLLTPASSGSGTVTGSGGGVGINSSSGAGSSLGGGGIGGSTAAFRFRNQSPSNRRSRERNRREFNRTHGSDQGGLLAYGSGGLGGLLGSSEISTIEGMGSMEDSRLSGMLILFDFFFYFLII